jgi:hypothetical protein
MKLEGNMLPGSEEPDASTIRGFSAAATGFAAARLTL